MSTVPHTRTFSIGIACLHFMVALTGILYHEVWLDEAHHFLLARDSSSLGELYKNAAYDGHPLLWDSCLFLITRFSSSVIWMQLFHLSLMSCCVYLVVRHAPFKKAISVLLVFGYFFIYEYAVISRNYAISLLFILLVLVQLGRPARNHRLIAMLLLLLAFTHIYSIIITLGFCGLLIYEYRIHSWKYLYGSLAVFCLLLLFSLNVPADHFLFRYDTSSLLSFKRIGKAFSMYLKGFLPVPDFTAFRPWNSNWVVAASKAAGTVLSLLLAAVPFFIFKKSKAVLFFFYGCTLCICLFSYLSPLMVASRHCGFLFIVLVASFWLRRLLYPGFSPEQPVYQTVAVIVLCLHLVSGLYLLITDIQRPFSNARNLAAYLKANRLDEKEIVLSNLSTGPPVAAYLGQTLSYLESGKNSSFCKWNTWPFVLSAGQTARKVAELAPKDSSILILSDPYPMGSPEAAIRAIPGLQLIRLAVFEGAMVRSENYTVYYLIRSSTGFQGQRLR